MRVRPCLADAPRGAAGLVVQVAEQVFGVSDPFGRVEIFFVPDAPKFLGSIIVFRNQGLYAVDGHGIFLEHAVIVFVRIVFWGRRSRCPKTAHLGCGP